MHAMQTESLAIAPDVMKSAEVPFVKTIPSELARTTVMSRPFASVELTNGAVITGHICEIDPFTMNIKLDSVTHTSVKRRFDGKTNANCPEEPSPKKVKSEVMEGGRTSCVEEDSPIAFRCVSQVVIRGSCVRYIDFPSPETGGNSVHGFEELLKISNTVRPSV
ncbi:unnamed protein product [Phytomonas sp. EM1]|nr:unnamed protein product [Phytomonas sp. EM1]|eukprot:CCW64657.1 unnamed protein product [Phytomonas sp. isolate EM1]